MKNLINAINEALELDIREKSQKPEFAFGRQMAYYYANKELLYSYEKIAKHFKQSRTTAYKSGRRIKELLEINDKMTLNLLSHLKNKSIFIFEKDPPKKIYLKKTCLFDINELEFSSVRMNDDDLEYSLKR